MHPRRDERDAKAGYDEPVGHAADAAIADRNGQCPRAEHEAKK
jgi:hypothetical protein